MNRYKHYEPFETAEPKRSECAALLRASLIKKIIWFTLSLLLALNACAAYFIFTGQVLGFDPIPEENLASVTPVYIFISLCGLAITWNQVALHSRCALVARLILNHGAVEG